MTTKEEIESTLDNLYDVSLLFVTLRSTIDRFLENITETEVKENLNLVSAELGKAHDHLTKTRYALYEAQERL